MSNVSKRKKLAVWVGLVCLTLFIGFTGVCFLAWAQAGQLKAHGLTASAQVVNYAPSGAGTSSLSTVTVEFVPRGTTAPITSVASYNANTPPPKTVLVIYDPADPASVMLVGQNPQKTDLGFGVAVGAITVVDLGVLAVIFQKDF
jgi:hypothetical protein